MSTTSGWGRFTWGQANWNADATLKTGWGAQTWSGEGGWGDLSALGGRDPDPARCRALPPGRREPGPDAPAHGRVDRRRGSDDLICVSAASTPSR